MAGITAEEYRNRGERATLNTALGGYTVVHETDGNRFSLEKLRKALSLQSDAPKFGYCSTRCCRLNALKDGKCFLCRGIV